MTAPAACPAGSKATGGPLLFYLQSSSPGGIARDAAGTSDINNEEISLFIQDKWQAGHGLTLDYGFRWDAQLMPETVDPTTTAYALFLNDPRFPSDGTIPDQWKQFQPRAKSDGVRVFDRDYQNPRIYSFNVGFERELATSVAGYVDFTVAKSVHLTRFFNYNHQRIGCREAESCQGLRARSWASARNFRASAEAGSASTAICRCGTAAAA